MSFAEASKFGSEVWSRNGVLTRAGVVPGSGRAARPKESVSRSNTQGTVQAQRWGIARDELALTLAQRLVERIRRGVERQLRGEAPARRHKRRLRLPRASHAHAGDARQRSPRWPDSRSGSIRSRSSGRNPAPMRFRSDAPICGRRSYGASMRVPASVVLQGLPELDPRVGVPVTEQPLSRRSEASRRGVRLEVLARKSFQ